MFSTATLVQISAYPGAVMRVLVRRQRAADLWRIMAGVLSRLCIAYVHCSRAFFETNL